MSTVFISYRRGDEPFAVDQIERFLSVALGPDEVFRDTSDIAFGSDFRAAMDDAVQRHAVLLVVIGRGWNLQRLADPNDNVRFEIERGLALGKRILPVLVGAATWPDVHDLPASLKAFATLNYIAFRPGADSERDQASILQAVTATRPVVLSGKVKGRTLMFGRVELRLDGQDVGRGPMNRDLPFGPVRLSPGNHVFEANATITGVGRRTEHRFSLQQPGEWFLEVDYQRSSGTFSFTLHPPARSPRL